MPDLVYFTKCRICGANALKADALPIPIIGDPPNAHAGKMVEALFKHLVMKHADRAAAILAGSREFTGILTAMLFETEDPGLALTLEQARERIHDLTAPPPLKTEPQAIAG